ncbi:SprT family protein [Vagococcus silagei]|uniref:SprT family protein n=1 Tax=Vagococcus silagei TaxID=2508885 RepID=A0A4S3B5K8_9ENTE|nr:SprT family protein [Vagococcus silagei]THB62381.1 SprT family protein [Vagococcus silagei]
MSQEELQTLVEQISRDVFKREFRHTAIFNKRLKTTGGRYHLSDHHLDFNPLVLEKHGMTELVGVIKHELCHYHLHLEGKGYRHQDVDFKKLLQETGGSRYVKAMQTPTEMYSKLYQCTTCQKKYPRRRRMNTNRYRCQCGGRLEELTNTK